MHDDENGLIETLASSRIYQEYERAFSDATGLPVTLRPVESWKMPLRGHRNENPFCALMSQKSRSCAVCMQTQQQLTEAAAQDACSISCPMGLSDTAVPLRIGDRLIGFLQTGQWLHRAPTRAQVERVVKLCQEWGVAATAEQVEQTYSASKVVSTRQQEAVQQLLAIFAQHLSSVCNQILVQRENAEPVAIRRAKEYIQQHHTEDISLGQVAKAVNMSTFYFCKMFKKATGVNFTDYVSRVRIEQAKNLLLNPNLRISEIAYEVGFQSLTHFNRVFRRVIGQSPTQYRSALPRS